MTAPSKLSRRELITLGISSTGLTLAVSASSQKAPQLAAFQPSAYLRIDPTGKVTIWCTRTEIGQGVRTSLAMLVADELEADWSTVRVAQAPFHAKFGDQNTIGSMSVKTLYEPLRTAGAAAREMLVAAAAKEWKVNPESCQARAGFVFHAPTKRNLSFGALAPKAADLPVPASPKWKEDSALRLIGKGIRRIDSPDRVTGKSVYSIDVRVPGMLFACLKRCPVFGGKAASFDDAKAKKVPGVRMVLQIPSGIAVVADNTFAAIQGREALQVTWEEGPNAKDTSITLRSAMDDASKNPGKNIRVIGKVEPDSAPVKTIEAVYETTFQAHAPMEPVSCTAHVTKDSCIVWAPAQMPGFAHAEACRASGLPAPLVKINITDVGGAFGRLGNTDFVSEAVLVSKALGKPVKVFRTREDDIQHDFYRPATLHRMKGGLDADGKPVLWMHHIVSTSLMASMNPAAPNPEMFEMGGASDFPYAIPNFLLAYSHVPTHVPRGFWRAVEHGPNAFAIQCFLDEIAGAAGKDPVEFRLSLLEEQVASVGQENDRRARLRGVIELAAEKSAWGKNAPVPRSGRGFAAHASHGSYVAQVAEVDVDIDGNVKVNRIVCAIDCGKVVNPNTIAAQMEGSIAMGLAAALKHKIDIENGRVAQSNFHNYPMLRIDEMPKVEVHIVPSKEAPGGVGEPGLPPIATALCNALFAATGVRIRALPIRTRLLRLR